MQNLLNYTGWKKWCPTVEECADFEAEGKLPFDLLENEYLIIYEDKELTKPIQQYCYENNELRKVGWQSIKVPKIKLAEPESATADEILAGKNDAKSLRKAAKRKSKNKYSNKEEIITPRNVEQAILLDMLKDSTKLVKVILGCFGSGKTYLTINVALQRLFNGEFEKIIFIRNNVKVANTFDYGYLKGDLTQKMLPWLTPVADSIGLNNTLNMIDKGTLVAEPLSMIRGRNFSNSLVFCDEVEQLSLDHLKLILGRCGAGSELVLCGDLRQRDLDIFEKSKGMEKLINTFKGDKRFSYVYLTKSERGPIAQMADDLDKACKK